MLNQPKLVFLRPGANLLLHRSQTDIWLVVEHFLHELAKWNPTKPQRFYQAWHLVRTLPHPERKEATILTNWYGSLERCRRVFDPLAGLEIFFCSPSQANLVAFTCSPGKLNPLEIEGTVLHVSFNRLRYLVLHPNLTVLFTHAVVVDAAAYKDVANPLLVQRTAPPPVRSIPAPVDTDFCPPS